jgi:hypothetical protein
LNFNESLNVFQIELFKADRWTLLFDFTFHTDCFTCTLSTNGNQDNTRQFALILRTAQSLSIATRSSTSAIENGGFRRWFR